MNIPPYSEQSNNIDKENQRLYYWQGLTQSGELISGTLLASNELDVRERLFKQNIHIDKIRSKPPWLTLGSGRKIKAKQITIMTRQLATMLEGGLTLLESLTLIYKSLKNPHIKSLFYQISKEVESGVPLSQALKVAEIHFDQLYINLVGSGESSGNLTEVLFRLASYREKSQQLTQNLLKATLYPFIVLLTATAVTVVMLILVIPEFESMFSGFDAELPWFTQQILNLSDWVQHTFSYLIIFSLLTLLLFRFLRSKFIPLQIITSKLLFSAPIVGNIIRKSIIAKFSHTLSTNFSAGVPILTGLKDAANTVGNQYYQVLLEQIYQQTKSGVPIHVSLKSTSQKHENAFPELMIQMVMIGEQSGKLDEMLNRLAAMYEKDIDNAVDSLGKVLEPALIVFLSTIVGSLLMAMYLPIFSLMSLF